MAAQARRGSLGPGFRRLWVASTVSNLGDGVLVSAMPLLARSITDDPVRVASITVAATIPWLAFGLVAGVVVDRVDKLRLMVIVDLLRAGVLVVAASVVAGGHRSLVVLVVVALLLGAGETLFDTASQAVLPAVVDAPQLEVANGRLFGAQLVANGFAGPALGGVLVAVSAWAPLSIDAATFAVSAVVLVGLRSAGAVARPARAPTRVRTDLSEGLRWLWQQPTVRALAVGAAVVNVAHTAALAVLVLLVRDELGGSTGSYGAVVAVASIDGVVGTQLSAPAARALGRRGALVGAVGAFASGLALVGVASSLPMVVAGLALFGVGGEVWNVVAVSHRQARVPEHLLGRVMAAYRFVAYGAMPVGAALGGAVAAVEIRAPFLLGAALTAVLGIHLARATASDADLVGADRRRRRRPPSVADGHAEA